MRLGSQVFLYSFYALCKTFPSKTCPLQDRINWPVFFHELAMGLQYSVLWNSLVPGFVFCTWLACLVCYPVMYTLITVKISMSSPVHMFMSLLFFIYWWSTCKKWTETCYHTVIEDFLWESIYRTIYFQLEQEYIITYEVNQL